MGHLLHVDEVVVIEREQLQQLLVTLQEKGYTVIGPTVRDQAIVYDTVTSLKDLPVGYTDEQDGGSYRLKRRADEALFGYAVGPQSWKHFLFPPRLRLWQARRQQYDFQVEQEPQAEQHYAFLGVRACELHAIAIQDRVFLRSDYAKPHYQSRRRNLFMIAVNCGHAGGTCFCVSMQTGPKATADFDLALTEILTPERHFFVMQIGSEAGAAMLQDIPCTLASSEERMQAEEVVERTAHQMGRQMETDEIKETLYRNLEHPRWQEVASRCLTCGNCTMVCPTCFCTAVEDVTDLTGTTTERWRRWDSCFTMDFSHLTGGSVRPSASSRYRQWMTHKLASWIDQFGTSGCVGCGRCITWCPVGIDITEEMRAIRASTTTNVPQNQQKASEV